MKNENYVSKFGYWSATFSCIFALAYILAQLSDFAGLFGPQSSALGLVSLMLPSFFLAFSYLILAVSIHNFVPQHRKIFSHVGLVLAILYAALIIIVYYVQLTFVIPNLIRNTVEEISVFIFIPFNSFLFALDVLGYGIMNLSTLFFAFAFEKTGPEKWIRYFLIMNGVLFPTNLFSMLFPPLLILDFPWAITFPVSMILLAKFFKQQNGQKHDITDRHEGVSKEIAVTV